MKTQILLIDGYHNNLGIKMFYKDRTEGRIDAAKAFIYRNFNNYDLICKTLPLVDGKPQVLRRLINKHQPKHVFLIEKRKTIYQNVVRDFPNIVFWIPVVSRTNPQVSGYEQF